MTEPSPKRSLPLIPHHDHLRKQAKARLAAMRIRNPTARLAHAQSLIAREYGFANWNGLLGEVNRRVKGPNQVQAPIRRALTACGDRLRAEDEEDHADAALRLFSTWSAAQAATVFVALVGMGILFLPLLPGTVFHGSAVRIGPPLARFFHHIL